MSEENVELIRGGIEAYNARGLDAVSDFAHAEAVAHPFPEWIGDSIYRGKEGWRRLLLEWIENFDDFAWEIDELIDANDKVVALLRIHGRIKGTDIRISQPVGAVFADFREDRTVAEGHFFLTYREAIEAAGLSE